MIRALTRSVVLLITLILILSSVACQRSIYGTESRTDFDPNHFTITNPSTLGGTILSDVTYSRQNGENLNLDIYYPKVVTGLVPTIVYVHGGAWISGDKQEVKEIIGMPAFLEAGFAIVSINYRLAPQYKFPASIKDVRCAIRFLRAYGDKFNLATEKIGAYGCSAGGHLVSLLGVADENSAWNSVEYYSYSSSVQAVVDMYGPTDLTAQFPADEPVKLEDVFATNDVNGPVLRDASPAYWVSSTDPPFLIIHGDIDPLVPLSQSKDFSDRLINAGVDTTLIVVKNGNHGLDSRMDMLPSRSQLSQTILDFFNQHLLSK